MLTAVLLPNICGIFLRKMNYPKVQLVQNLHKLQIMAKTYHYKFYSLPAIIAVGYRTNSTRATQFRQWATKVLDTFTRQGYVLDKDRLINGQIFDEDYFDHLVSEIQEIRASERRFYQKITDIYATAVDYSVDSKTTKDFLQPFRIKCTTLFTAVLLQRSLCNGQTTQKTTWG